MSAVVVVLDRDRKPNRLAYFLASAERIARDLDADGPYRLHTGREMVALGHELLERRGRRSVDQVVICAHGGTDWVIDRKTGIAIVARHPDLGQVDVAEVVAAWAPVCTLTVLWSLAACLCSRSPTWFLRQWFGRIWSQVASTWGKRSYVPGGQASIASRLRDMLFWFGLRGAKVRGHKSAGDLAGNPLLSEHSGDPMELSIPLCELALPGEPITIGFRRWWVKIVKGKLAERWLLGDDSVVEEIARAFKLRTKWNLNPRRLWKRSSS